MFCRVKEEKEDFDDGVCLEKAEGEEEGESSLVIDEATTAIKKEPLDDMDDQGESDIAEEEDEEEEEIVKAGKSVPIGPGDRAGSAFFNLAQLAEVR